MREKWPMVKYVADKMKDRLPANVDVEDLQASAAAGLLDALRRFDPARGVKFETYAPHRMRGFVLDDLRGADFVPRLARARHHRLERAFFKLEAQLGRTPTDREIACELGLTADELDQLRRETRGASFLPLKKLQLEKDPEALGVEVMPDRSSPDPADLAERAGVWERVRRVLPPKQAEVLELYYRDDLTLKEIGHVLGMSESRACQLHAIAIRKLRGRLG